jgi:hypothetical protein
VGIQTNEFRHAITRASGSHFPTCSLDSQQTQSEWLTAATGDSWPACVSGIGAGVDPKVRLVRLLGVVELCAFRFRLATRSCPAMVTKIDGAREEIGGVARGSVVERKWLRPDAVGW